MSIYTRRGDHGETSLADGSRVSKASARVEAYGTVDELGSCVGLARSAANDELLERTLTFVQQRLFNCAAILAGSGAHSASAVSAEDVRSLELAIDTFEAQTGALTGFVLTSGAESATRLHLARTVCRRAERRVVELMTEEPVDENVLSFLNRLSDLLFAAARYANHMDGREDEPWDQAAERPFS